MKKFKIYLESRDSGPIDLGVDREDGAIINVSSKDCGLEIIAEWCPLEKANKFSVYLTSGHDTEYKEIKMIVMESVDAVNLQQFGLIASDDNFVCTQKRKK